MDFSWVLPKAKKLAVSSVALLLICILTIEQREYTPVIGIDRRINNANRGWCSHGG